MARGVIISHIYRYKSSSANVYFTISWVTGDEEDSLSRCKDDDDDDVEKGRTRDSKEEKRSRKQENRY